METKDKLTVTLDATMFSQLQETALREDRSIEDVATEILSLWASACLEYDVVRAQRQKADA